MSTRLRHCIRTSLVLATMLCVCSVSGSIAVAKSPSAKSPNVVFILADDLGWSDTTLYGTTKLYKTPNIERLAKRGMTFTRAHSASPLCSPTRASVLTGLSPARHGITSPNCHLPQVVLTATPGTSVGGNKPSILPSPVTRLATDYPTLPKTLKRAGYATGHFGKWHLGAPPYSPLEHSFDVDVPHWPGPGPAGSFVAPWKFPDFDPQTPNEHIEDRMAKEAVDFMTQHRDEPFLLNYWMFSVHAPFDAKQDLIEAYREIVDKQSPQRSPIYAAMVESMDDAVGTLLDKLDELGIADNTIIVFTSDNGGNMYNVVEDTTATSNAPLRGGKATMYEGGTRVPLVISWPGHVQGGSTSDALANSCDFYPTLLEMLGMKPDAGQSFDGASIVPALRGEPMNDNTVFTYFPHDPPVPDWMPPAVSVHHGDWKLVRLFACGKDGGHRWKLFNLKDDIGETIDLASQRPELVRELDQRIEKFLQRTNAVLPIANPNFDPAAYDVSREGEPGAGHYGSKVSNKPKNKKRANRKTFAPVAGWTSSGDCDLKLVNGSLVIESVGEDPFISTELDAPSPPGDFVLELTAASNSSGDGQVFWREQGTNAFSAERRLQVDMLHDGQMHTYRVPLAADKPITGLRIDPSRDAGTITITGITLLTHRDDVVKHWSFRQ